MKKVIALGTIVFSLVLSGSALAASENTNVVDNTSVKVENFSYINDANFEVKVEQKSYSPTLSDKDLKNGTLAVAEQPHWDAKTNLGKTFKFPVPQAQFYSTGQSISDVAIDKIAVVTRLYHDGGILNTGNDSQSNSTLAAATAWQGTIILPTDDTYGQSNHTFEKKGYVSWYPETKESYNGW